MYKNILIPVLLDEESDNEESYSIAHALAEKDCKYTILHVVEPLPTYVAPEIPIELMEQRNEAVNKSLKEATAELPGATPRLISGHAGSMIVDYAEENQVDCIILKSHKPGIQDFFLGSTAARVVRHAKCSVHVIR